MRLLRMVENSPNERTVARGETCFDEATRVGKTVPRTNLVPLAAPSARRPLAFYVHACFASMKSGFPAKNSRVHPNPQQLHQDRQLISRNLYFPLLQVRESHPGDNSMC